MVQPKELDEAVMNEPLPAEVQRLMEQMKEQTVERSIEPVNVCTPDQIVAMTRDMKGMGFQVRDIGGFPAIVLEFIGKTAEKRMIFMQVIGTNIWMRMKEQSKIVTPDNALVVPGQ